MLKSLRKFNKNVFVYVTYPPPLSYPKRKGLSRGMCVDREGGIKGGDMYVRSVSHVRGAR